MQKLSFVIGATATGKTHFIEHHFSDENSVVLNIFENFEPIEIDLKSMQNEFNIMRSNIYDDKAKEVLEKSIYNLKNSLKNNKYLWNDNDINIESEDFRL